MIFRRDFLAALSALALCACAAPQASAEGPLEPLEIVTRQGVVRFQVEIADDSAERSRGLMFRDPLPDNRGMLFIFPVAEEQGFWMKNTPSPLDIVYIGANGRIVSIARDTKPYSEETIPSGGPAQFVLEIRAGRAAQAGINPGDRVRHRAIPAR